MRTIKTKLYSFTELSEKAKKKAIEDNYSINTGNYWNDFIMDDFEHILDLLGIDARIRYSGFGSQGDGLSFVGRFVPENVELEKLKAEYPTDMKLHTLATELKKYIWNYNIESNNSRYCHSHTMYLENRNYDEFVEDNLLDILREVADDFYSKLEDEYLYRTSDDIIEESLIENGIEFYENGEKYNGR